MGIKHHIMLIYTKKEVAVAQKQVQAKYRKMDISNNEATSFFDSEASLIYVDLKHTKLVSDLIDSIVHELLHLKEPKLRHGKKYQDMINDIIINE